MTEDEVLEYAGNMADEFREGLADGSTIVSDGPWEETVKAIKERRKRNETKNGVYPFARLDNRRPQAQCREGRCQVQ